MPDETVKKSDSTPGPAHYALPSTIGHAKHDISKSRSPSFTMGIRLPGFFCDKNMTSPSPGPKYQVEYMTKYGRANVPSIASSTVRMQKRPQSAPNDLADGNHSKTRNLSPRRFQDVSDIHDSGDMSEKLEDNRKEIMIEISSHMSINNRLRSFCNEYHKKPFTANMIKNAKLLNTRKYLESNGLKNGKYC